MHFRNSSNIIYSITQMGAFFNFFFVFLLIDYYFILGKDREEIVKQYKEL